MSRKRFNPLEDPPAASSSDEDDLETSMGEGEEDIARNTSSEEEDDVSSKNPAALKNTVLLLAAPTEKLVSDPESGSDEETDTDSEPEMKDQVVTKRSRETDEAEASTDVKRAKKVSGEEEKKSGGGEETKKTYFQRLWTEDDEIAVLQGLNDYKNDTGVSPYEDTNKVYQLVKKSISFDVSKIQFMEKLRSLKKKYENNLGKAKDGDEPTFVKTHDRKAFELSKLVWGGIRMALQSGMKSNGKSKKSSKSKKVESVKHEFDCEDDVTNKGEASLVGALEMDTLVKSSLVRLITRFGVDELVAQQGLSLLSSEDKKRFEEQWKALQVREFEFLSQKSAFLHKVVTKMTEVSPSNA